MIDWIIAHLFISIGIWVVISFGVSVFFGKFCVVGRGK